MICTDDDVERAIMLYESAQSIIIDPATGTAYIGEIVSCADVENIDENQIKDIINHLKTSGDLIEASNNFYRVVR